VIISVNFLMNSHFYNHLKFVIHFYLLVSSSEFIAQTNFTTVQDGNWDDPLTWGTVSFPTSSDHVIVNHVVTYNTGLTGGQELEHNGNITINVSGELTLLMANTSSFAFDKAALGLNFEVFGILTTGGRLFNYGFLQFHQGSVITIGNDLRVFGNSTTLIDTELNLDDDIYIFGPFDPVGNTGPSICGTVTANGEFVGFANLNDLDGTTSALQFRGADPLNPFDPPLASLDNICSGFQIFIFPPPPTVVEGTGSFGPLVDGVITMGISGSPFSENGGAATVRATLSTMNDSDVTVTLTASGTAINGVDYSLSDNEILIPAGSLSGNITVDGINDLLDEDDETIILDVDHGTNGSEQTPQQVTATITDDDNSPLVSLSLTGSPLAENAGIATVTANLSNPSSNDITIDLSFSGTATNGTDYTPSDNMILITAGNTSRDITITGIDDPIDENNETVIIDITNVSNGTEDGAQQVTAIIADDDDDIPQVTLGLSPGDIAEDGGSSMVTASLSKASMSNVDVGLQLTGTAGNGTDYNLNNSIFISAGNVSGSIALSAINDNINEDDETIIIDILSITNAVEDGEQQVTATIIDDDAIPFITGENIEITEGDQKNSLVSFNLTLSNPSEKTISVDYSTAENTALANSDFVFAEASMLIFNPGETSRTIDLEIIGDNQAEGDEIFFVNLSNPDNAMLQNMQMEVTIKDDDSTPQAMDDVFSINEDQVLSVGPPGILSNDNDEDGDALTITKNSGPENGTFSLNQDGSFEYGPAKDFDGIDGFTYVLSDGTNESEEASVSINIAPVNDPPTISSIEDQIIEQGEMTEPLIFKIGDTETPVEELVITFTSENLILVPNASISISGNGAERSIKITPIETETGEANIILNVSDGELSSTEEFAVIVNPNNNAPFDILLSDNRVVEDSPPGTLVGTFTTIDDDASDVHNYSLVDGEGDRDNDSFIIEDDELLTNEIFNFEEKSLLNIRVQSDDGEDTIEEMFDIIVTQTEISSAVFIPTLFSPNSDGRNDFFRVRGDAIAEIEIVIFNRFGTIVFETNDLFSAREAGWDGTHKSEKQPPGTYIWQIAGTLDDGSSLTFDGRNSGNVVLVR